MLVQLLFLILLIASIWIFTRNIRKVIRNIKLGKSTDRGDQVMVRAKTMFRVAFGQSKMAVRPIPAVLHFFVYAGFIIINIEILEILIDGLFGTHRIFHGLGKFYDFLIGTFEILALSVWLGCAVFLVRRNVLKLKRFSGTEMTNWPKSDANYILIIEILLMSAFLTMNAADAKLQGLGVSHYLRSGSFPVSGFFAYLLPDSPQSLIVLERGCWWFHIVGVLASLNYLPYSKHLHILLAFPNTYFSNLKPRGALTNMITVNNEVRAMLDPSFVPAHAVVGKIWSERCTGS